VSQLKAMCQLKAVRGTVSVRRSYEVMDDGLRTLSARVCQLKAMCQLKAFVNLKPCVNLNLKPCVNLKVSVRRSYEVMDDGLRTLSAPDYIDLRVSKRPMPLSLSLALS